LISETKETLRGIRVAFAMLCVSTLLLSGCAGVPTDPADREAYYETNDPIESFNRGVFSFNRGLDAVILKPLATIYDEILPQTLQDSIRNFLNNLRSPVILANNLLQGDMDGARDTIARFTVNTIVGFGGFGDPAGDLGVKYRSEDFGQTLAVWNVGEGPYLMLPLLGPSNPRDTVGLVVDMLIDPINRWADNTDRDGVSIGRTLVRGIDLRARNLTRLDELEKSSLDFYATIRSLYRQVRDDDIRNGNADDTVPSPSISFDEDPIMTGPRAQLIR
jgi:phospholipid-binding lipoprotein MlaA